MELNTSVDDSCSGVVRMSENNGKACSDVSSDAFSRFVLLTIHVDNMCTDGINSDNVQQVGSRYLDPFCIHATNALDLFPNSIQNSEGTASMLKPSGIAPFCFPRGVKARIIPKKAMKVAKRMGWMGKASDRYQIIAVADSPGSMMHGVAITVQEQVHSPELLAHLSMLRECRRASAFICRWWRRRIRKVMSHEKRRSKRGSVRSVGTISSLSGILRRSSADSESTVPRLRSDPESKPIPINKVLNEFIGNSHIPDFIWKKARLKRRKTLGDYIVLVQHIPVRGTSDQGLKNGVQEEYDFSTMFEYEKSRLLELVTGVDFSAPKLKCFRVSLITFQEIDPESKKIINETELYVASNDTISRSKSTANRCRFSHSTEGSEAYREMIEAEEHGDICVTEVCYVLMGCRRRELVLLFSALQQLIDVERNKQEGVFDMKSGHFVQSQCAQIDEGAKDSRHKILSVLQAQAQLSSHQTEQTFPKSELEHVYGNYPTFELKQVFDWFDPIVMPLPLPQVVDDWGLATLLIRIGEEALVKILKLLAIERSVLLLGNSSEQVTACVCALVELLKPFEWPNTVFSLLPPSMLDLLSSPLPFVVGMIVEGSCELSLLYEDYRVLDAMEAGMSIINLSSGSISTSIDYGEEAILAIPYKLSQRLRCLSDRLKRLLNIEGSSFGTLHSFVQYGLSREESLTLRSSRKLISKHMSNLAGDFAVDRKAWKRFGQDDDENKSSFNFCPEKYCNHIRAELSYRQKLAHTRMFSSFVHAKRNDDLEQETIERGRAGHIVACWVQKKMRQRRDRQLQCNGQPDEASRATSVSSDHCEVRQFQ